MTRLKQQCPVVIVALSFLFGFLKAHIAVADRIKVGVVAPLSGSAQMYGTALRNGIELARAEIPDLGLDINYEDDQFVSAKTVSAVHSLIDQKNVDLLITCASGPSNAAAPIAERAKVPLIAWASDRTSSLNRKYVIRSWMSGYEEGRKVAEEATRRGLANVVSVLSDNDYPRSMQEGFIANFPADKVLASEDLPADLRDFRPVILKAKAQGVENFFVCLNPGLSGLFAKQVRDLRSSAGFFGCENLHDRSEVEQSQGALLNSWFVSASATEEFRKKYRKRYGDESAVSGAAMHYDIVYLLHELSRSWKRGTALMPLLTQFSKRKGGIGEFEPVREGADQFFKIRLAVIEITKDGFDEK